MTGHACASTRIGSRVSTTTPSGRRSCSSAISNRCAPRSAWSPAGTTCSFPSSSPTTRRFALRADDVRLTIGPWKHVDPGVAREALRDALDWFDVHVRDDPPATRRSRVRIFVGGSRRWLDLEDWPPPARSVRWHLHTRAAGSGSVSRSRQLPIGTGTTPPTPRRRSGGSLLAAPVARATTAALERRRDVLVYTSAALVRDVEVIGPISAQLHVRSSLEHTDFFVRLCDVEPSGASRNICDGLARLEPASWRRAPDGTATVEVSLWPAAHVFRRGHRLRVHVCSGAHPQVRTQSRRGRATRHRDRHACCRPGDLARRRAPVGDPPSRPGRGVASAERRRGRGLRGRPRPRGAADRHCRFLGRARAAPSHMRTGVMRRGQAATRGRRRRARPADYRRAACWL